MEEQSSRTYTPAEWRLYAGRTLHRRLLTERGHVLPESLCGVVRPGYCWELRSATEPLAPPECRECRRRAGRARG